MWVVVKIMVPFWVPIIARHLLFRVPKKGTINFDSHPCKGLNVKSRILPGGLVDLSPPWAHEWDPRGCYSPVIIRRSPKE